MSNKQAGQQGRRRSAWQWSVTVMAVLGMAGPVLAADGETPVEREYVLAPPAPLVQTWDEARAKSNGCQSCHSPTDAITMHRSEAVVLGCTDCHGGDASVFKPEGTSHQAPGHGSHEGAEHGDGHSAGDAAAHAEPPHKAAPHADGHGHDAHASKYQPAYQQAMDSAHVLPRYPGAWHAPGSANPERTYTLLNREAPEFIRFMNPSDLRIAHEACGACHSPIVEAAKRSIMATSAMLWGGAAYNNGIVPFKRYIMGEGYERDGTPSVIKSTVPVTEEMAKRGALESLVPLPAWEVIPPGDIFRVFERGGRNINTTFAETGLPNSLGQIQRLEEPGRPDVKQSNRGPATGARIAVPVINIHKTRLNDPNMWFQGTNDNPGDFRNSGCSACHVPYANDRDPKHSGPYAQFGHFGETQTVDPTIPKGEKGHPLYHAFTRSIPTSQCMICHMHQPNMFINSMLGYTMWDYESDAPHMWPEEQHYPSHDEMRASLDRNPEEAVIRGKWRDMDFLRQVSEMNPKLKDTQFADYHGHGWNFRAILKRDRKGNLLDAAGGKIDDNDPKKWEKTVHMSSIHIDVGMHCVDCHFAQDMHGNGHIYGEVAQGVEIQCQDCHGTPDAYPTLVTSNTAASELGRNLANLRNPDGKKRFEWIDGKLIQRSLLNEGQEWVMSLLKDNSNPLSGDYNAKADRHHTMGSNTATLEFGVGIPKAERAHNEDKMLCYSCHTSWTTTCGGCHLPIQANWKTERHHFEGGFTRNYATYNPQVARDDAFQLAKHGPAKKFKIAPLRSTSALVLSSTNSNRERIYIQQPPMAASGFSSQAFGIHYPHTERKTETKQCTDCHISAANDNNAIMAQLLSQGTKFFDFLGFNAWVGGEGEINAIRVTEWEEPQAVVGSYLQRYAYPDWFKQHQDRGRELPEAYDHRSGVANCIQLRGEYLFVAEGEKGFRVYDTSSIANKGYSERFITAPFSPLGHDTHVESENATCVSVLTTQPIAPLRQVTPQLPGMSVEDHTKLMRETNMEQPFHPIYNYAFVTDAVEGLIVVDINTLADGEPRNNHLERKLTWNEGGVLDGARHLTNAGYFFYISTPKGVAVLNMNDPMQPKYVTTIDVPDPRAAQIQFRYLFVTTAKGLQVVDVTLYDQPKVVEGAVVPLQNAAKLHVARTFAYVAAHEQGLAIIDVTQPEKPFVYEMYTADGTLNDARDVTVATTNASLYAYVADGRNGLKVLQLTGPDIQPKFYGYSPDPKPTLIAWRKTDKPALSLSRALERDRAVDETGGQIAILGRIGSRPFNLEEMQKFFLDDNGKPWTVTDEVDLSKRVDANRRMAGPAANDKVRAAQNP